MFTFSSEQGLQNYDVHCLNEENDEFEYQTNPDPKYQLSQNLCRCQIGMCWTLTQIIINTEKLNKKEISNIYQLGRNCETDDCTAFFQVGQNSQFKNWHLEYWHVFGSRPPPPDLNSNLELSEENQAIYPTQQAFRYSKKLNLFQN